MAAIVGTDRVVSRKFTIHPGGARRAPAPPVKSMPPGREKTKIAAQIREEVQSLVDSGTSKSHDADRRRALSAWSEFCAILDLDPNIFGRVGTPSPEQLQRLTVYEGEILSHFIAFIRIKPTKSAKHRRPLSYHTAANYLRNVTAYYHEERGRCPGKFQSGNWTFQLARTLKGVKNNAPLAKLRLPIMQQDLHKVRKQLNLRANAYHRVLWALWLTQWQAGCRASDLIRAEDDRKRKWDPKRDLHRGRVHAERAFTSENKPLGVKLVITMKPLKNDKRNERIIHKSLVIDTSAKALSAGAAILHMLKMDPNSDNNAGTPLFRDPLTKKEISYVAAASALKGLLKKAGLHELASGLHCLRIGGTTAVCVENQRW